MVMVYKSRHFKRTVLVIAIIGGMWYLYVTKTQQGSSKEVRREDIHPLTLQERMQEVLAAREWLAENSVRMGYDNTVRGSGDPYSPNRLFNNAPPKTYYGAGAIDDRQGNFFLNGPFAGGSGDLDKFRHGANAPGYPDARQNGAQVQQQQFVDSGRYPVNAGQVPGWNQDPPDGNGYDLQKFPTTDNGNYNRYPMWNNNPFDNVMRNVPVNANPQDVRYIQNYSPYPGVKFPISNSDSNSDQNKIKTVEPVSTPILRQNHDPNHKTESISKTDTQKQLPNIKSNAQSDVAVKQIPNPQTKSDSPANPVNTHSKPKSLNVFPPAEISDKVLVSNSPLNETPPPPNNPSLPVKKAQSSNIIPAGFPKLPLPNVSSANNSPPAGNNFLPQPADTIPLPVNNAPSPPKLPPTNLQLSAKLRPSRAPATTTQSQSFVGRFLSRLLNSGNQNTANNPDDVKEDRGITSPLQRNNQQTQMSGVNPKPIETPKGVLDRGGGAGANVMPSRLGLRPEEKVMSQGQRYGYSPLSFLPSSLTASFRRPVQPQGPPVVSNNPALPLSKSAGSDPTLLQQQPQQKQPQKEQVQGSGGGSRTPDNKKSPPPSSSSDPQYATMVSRDKIRWQVDPCPDKGTLTKATLRTPYGHVGLYTEVGTNDTDTEAFNTDFGVLWNMHGVGTLFDRCLLPKKNVSLVDIGSGVGQVAFTAAALGRDVYAIEPIDSLAHAMCRTVTDFNYNNVRVIHNAASDDRTKVFFRKSFVRGQKKGCYEVDLRNKSKIDPKAPSAFTIKLDDILRLYKITSAALRIDVEGFEGRVLEGANKFLNTVDIPCILMEWKNVHAQKQFGGSDVFEALSKRGFFPHDVNTLKPLKVFRMHYWPEEVLWAKIGSYPVKL